MAGSEEPKTIPGHVGTQKQGRTRHSGAEVSPCVSPAKNRWSDQCCTTNGMPAC